MVPKKRSFRSCSKLWCCNSLINPERFLRGTLRKQVCNIHYVSKRFSSQRNLRKQARSIHYVSKRFSSQRNLRKQVRSIHYVSKGFSSQRNGRTIPKTNEIVTHICSCHNFFPLSSVQIIIIPACCLLCVL